MFSTRDIRRGMDVYHEHGQYIGTVLLVRERPARLKTLPAAGQRFESGFSGESIGPVSTAAVGNVGPQTQRPGSDYGAAAPAADVPSEVASFVVGSFRNLLLRCVDVADVESVSMERVIVRDSDG